ncbi:unnamed protein product [Arctogadus glacialis]
MIQIFRQTDRRLEEGSEVGLRTPERIAMETSISPELKPDNISSPLEWKAVIQIEASLRAPQVVGDLEDNNTVNFCCVGARPCPISAWVRVSGPLWTATFPEVNSSLVF